MSDGKYDAQCEALLRETQAQACVVIVLGGIRGAGFSLSVDVVRAPGALTAIVSSLRAVADHIERQAKSD